jgi:group II intron reverse transcriptase/maturase
MKEEVCAMQNAESVRKAICAMGRKGVPLERVYRLLYNPDLYLTAYGRLYRNKGATTPGATGETVEGMSLDKIKAIIELLRYERYRWSPARRVYIPKANGKKRPLGLPGWSDKLVQEVMRMILEAYYEPRFSDRSHGFRPGRGPHTALSEIRHHWKGTCWFIEGDIKGCFDNIDHKVLLDILREDIHDERFIRLIGDMLEAGYMEDWEYGKTLSGCPQGGVISPILSNIYLHKVDTFVEQQLLPAWNQGQKRKANRTYERVQMRAWRYQRKGKREEARAARRLMRTLPSVDTTDQEYRRLRYIRYADDFLLGFAGPKSEAEQIKKEIGHFLCETLKLEMSEAKTLVTHAKMEKAHFLGYEVCTMMENSYRGPNGLRAVNAGIGLRVPLTAIDERVKRYMRNGKPVHRAEQLINSDFTIISDFQNVYRGIVDYWRLAYNLGAMSRLKWVMDQSLVKTLASKYKTTCSATRKKYRAKVTINGKSYKVFQVKVDRPGKDPLVATWGGITLAWNPEVTLNDQPAVIWNGRTELVQRLLAQECEWCGETEGLIAVHHKRALKDLKGRTEWEKLMAARKRKTLALCKECHLDVTYGRPMRRQPSGTGFMHDPKGWRRKQAQT